MHSSSPSVGFANCRFVWMRLSTTMSEVHFNFSRTFLTTSDRTFTRIWRSSWYRLLVGAAWPASLLHIPKSPVRL